MLVLLLVLVLENSAYLAVKSDGTKMFAEGSGSLFGAEVPRIEHDDEHEHDSLPIVTGYVRRRCR